MESHFSSHPIEAIADNEQTFIRDYNRQTANFKEKIPLVPRNKETGWPLLQISSFTVVAESTQKNKTLKYEPVLGGRDCHDLNLNFYFLADLLKHTFYYQEERDDFINIYNMQALINKQKNFHVKLKPPFVLEVKAESGALKSTQYSITLNHEKLLALWYLFTLGNSLFIDQEKIKLFDVNWKGYSFDEKEINDHINKEFCTFYNGQIYLDLGKVFHKTYRLDREDNIMPNLKVIETQHDQTINIAEKDIVKINEDTVSMFSTLFQIDKFNEVYQQHLQEEKNKPVPIKVVDPIQASLEEVKQLFGNHEGKLNTNEISRQIVEKTTTIKSPLEKLKKLDLLFNDVIHKNEITYEYFRPSMSIFFNNKICNTQKADVKAIKLAYLMVIKKALLDESEDKLSLKEKNEIIKHARQANNLIDYHTKFLFGYTNTRNSFDRLVTYAHQNDFLSDKRKKTTKEKPEHQ